MQNDSTTTETTTTAEAEPVQGLHSLRDFLSVADPVETPAAEATEQDGEPSGNADKVSPPSKFNDLAEVTGIDLDSLYALEISSNDGEPLTIQDLKNAHSKQADMALKEIQWEETNRSSRRKSGRPSRSLRISFKRYRKGR